MANNNDWLINLVGKLDPTKTKKQIDDDIEKIQGQLNDVELKAKLGSAVVSDLEKQLNNLRVNLTDVTIPQSTLDGLVNQINNALRGIQIPNISTGSQAQQAGQQYGQQFHQGFNSAIQKGNLQRDFSFSANDKNDVAKRAQQYFRGISNGIVTVNEQMERLDDNSELRAFTINIKNAKGEIESLRYSLRNITDDNGKVTGQVFSYTGGSINDVNVVKEFAKHQKTVTDFTIKLEKLKATYANANVDYSEYDKVFRRFENGTASINELRLAFNKLESDIKTVAQGLKSQSASLDPIQQALNNMRDLPSMLTTLQSNMDGIKDKTSIASISVQGFTDEYNKLQTAMTNNGGKVPLTQDWVNEYQSLMSSVTSATKQVDALKKAEASDNSSTQKQANYYSTILSNYREIYSLKKKLITAGEEETKVIKEQIRSLNASNASIYKQIGNQGLKDTDWQKQVDDLENELKYSLRISEAHQKDKTIQSNLNDEQKKSVQIINELEQAYQRVQDIKIKISSLDKERDSEKITTLSKEELSAQEEYNKLYDKLRKRKNYDKDIWKETKSAIDDVTKSQIEYNNAKSQDALNKVQKTELANFRTLKDRWDKQGVLVGEFKIKVEQLEASLASVGSKGELDNLKTDIKDLKLEASQLLEANREYEKAEKELTATLEKRRVAQANSAKEKAKSNAQQELTQQREVNAILSKQESAYKEIWNINKQISKLDETEDSDIISVLNEKKKFYQDIYLSAQKELQAYNNIVVSQEHLASLAEIRKKAESEIGVITAKQSKAQADEVNKIQHSLSIGDYDTQLKSYSIALQKAGIEGEDLKNKLKGASDALENLKTSTSGEEIVSSAVVARADELTNEFEKLTNVVKNVKLDNTLIADDIKVNDTITRLNEQLRKNGAYASSAKDKIQEWIRELESGNVAEARLRAINSEAKALHSNMAQLDKIGKSKWQTFVDGVKSFTEWTTASGAVMEVVQAVRVATKNVKELDDQLLELSKVSDLSADGLKKIAKEAYELGDTVGKTGTQVLESITTFKRAGFELADSTALAETAMKMVNVAEGIDDASESAQYLISIMKGYGDTSTEFATKILDSVNEVSNTRSVDFDNLVDGGQRLSAVANQAGVSFDQMLGVLTGGYEVLGNMEKTASGLITIFTRLQSIQLADEEDVESVAKLQKTFSSATNGRVNIVDQATGQLRGAYDILNDLNKVWNELDKNTQEGLAFAAGGTRQKSVFLSIMSNWESVEKSVQSATDSMGSAEEENAKYLESLSGKLTILELAIEKLSNTVLNSGILGFFVDLGTTGINAIDGLINALTPLGTIGLIGGAGLGLKNIGREKTLSLIEYAYNNIVSNSRELVF